MRLHNFEFVKALSVAASPSRGTFSVYIRLLLLQLQLQLLLLQQEDNVGWRYSASCRRKRSSKTQFRRSVHRSPQS